MTKIFKEVAELCCDLCNYSEEARYNFMPRGWGICQQYGTTFHLCPNCVEMLKSMELTK